MGRPIVGVVVLIAALLAFGYFRSRDVQRPSEGSAAERLQPVAATTASGRVQRTVYVPIYSSLYLGVDIKKNMVELAATLSIRNISPQHPIILDFVRYYDSSGQPVKDYLAAPAQLNALASVEYVVQTADTRGGPGANFLVRWTGPAGVDEPLIEAVMIGRSGNAGISFTTAGRTVTNDLPK
jgi:uncharacterized protein DUF3124